MDTRTLPAAFSQAVEWYPERLAFVQADADCDRRYTYTKAYEAACRFADALAARDVEAGDRVAFLSRTTAEHAIAYFGTQLAGAVPVTIHIREAPATVGAMLNSISPTTIVFQPEFDSLVESALEAAELGISAPQVYFDQCEPDVDPDVAMPYSTFVADASADYTPVSVAPDDVAFLNFSSGTTGTPKGVVHTHAEAVEGAHLGQYKLQIRRGGTYLIQATPSFIGWSMLLFPTVNTGATSVFLERWSPEAVLEATEIHGLDLLLLVSTQWREVLDADLDAYDTSSVSRAIYTGESIGLDLLSEIRGSVCEDTYTVYSSTEALNAGTVLFPESVSEKTVASVGKPVPNVDLRLIEPQSGDPSAMVPHGEVGEVILRGPPVAERVWNPRPETADLFHPDGWWFSSDLGRIGDGGNLFLTGRIDNLIISGGINIYAEHVERELERHPDVEVALVVGVSDEQWGETVKAYVIETEVGVTADTLDLWCINNEALGDYQRPRQYEFVSSLPRTSSGKLDRNAFNE